LPAADVWPGRVADSQRPAAGGNPGAAVSVPGKGLYAPEKLADAQTLHLPYAQEWLTAAECDDLLAFLKASLTQIAEIVRLDAHRLAAALKPSVTPRLMDRRFGDWRVLADEYEHENWLDENDTDVLDAVLDAVLVRGASFCPILLTVVNERQEEIEAAGVITDMLRFPGDPARRWLDRRVLREVVSEARATPVQTE
jgi:phosphoketolase